MFRLTRPTSPPLLDGNDTVGGENNSSTTTTTNCRQQAALSRSSRKLEQHHPNVKLPKRLEEKSKEEQILRSCDRFKSYPTTVDTLIRTLTTISNHPHERKYRHINKTNKGYQRSLANVPGAEQLLVALGFTPYSNNNTLYLPRVDQELVLFALNVLEQTRATREYQHAKRQQVFSKEVAAQLRAMPTATTEEQTKRHQLLSKLPKEPSSRTHGSVIMIQLNDNISTDTSSTMITRRFDSDDTLDDVLNWIGGTVGSVFVDKLSNSQEWSLVDVNRYGPKVPIDCFNEYNRQKTLQHLGFWPSGRLALHPTSNIQDAYD